MIRVWFLTLAAAIASPLSAGSAADRQMGDYQGTGRLPRRTRDPEAGTLNVTQDKDHCLCKGDDPRRVGDRQPEEPRRQERRRLAAAGRHVDPKAELTKTRSSRTTPSASPPSRHRPAVLHVRQPHHAWPGPATPLVVKNPAPVPHNFFWSSANNGEYNVTVPKMDQWKMPQALVAEGPPIQYKCTIHGWMTGYVRIFDHPYYAVTDENGNFEIKNAPAGKFRIVLLARERFQGRRQGPLRRGDRYQGADDGDEADRVRREPEEVNCDRDG